MNTELQINIPAEHPNTSRDQNVIATEINIIKAQTNKILLSSAIEIGKRLKEAKQMIGHGNWEKWLETEVSYSQRTATNLMRIHDEYGLKLTENQIGKQLADLGYTQAVAMLKLDFEERENFIETHDIDAMTTRELDAAIAERNEVLKQKEALEERITNLIELSEKQSKELITTEAKLKAHEDTQKKLKKLQEDNAVLKQSLLEAKDQERPEEDDDAEEIADLEAKFLESNKQIDYLKKTLEAKQRELDEAPEEVEKIVEVTKTIEVVPESMQKEMDTLKAKLKASDTEVKYKATFEVIVSLFNDLVATLDKMKANDTETYEKYKNATNNLLERLRQ